MFVLSIMVCKIITYEQTNALDSQFFTWKMKLKDVDDVNENWWPNLLHKCAFV